MPLYYFDVRDGAETIDPDGIMLPDLEAAKTYAIDGLPDLARDELPGGEEREFVVTVRNTYGRKVFEASLVLRCRLLDPDSQA